MNYSLNIYTDGGSRGNPGPSACAFVVFDENGNLVHEGNSFLGTATNNQAEYQAVLLAFNWLITNRTLPEQAQVRFFIDSQLVASQLGGSYRVKNPSIRELYEKIKGLETTLGRKIDYSLIPREKNSRADFLVNQALDKVLTE